MKVDCGAQMKYAQALMIALLFITGYGLVSAVRADTPAQPVVRAVEIRGFVHLSQEDQQKTTAIVTPLQGQPYNQEKVDAAVEQIDQLGWFSYEKASTEPVEDGVRLVIDITENPVIETIKFDGNSVFTDQQLRALIKTQPGQVLNQHVASADANAIHDAYYKAGYVYAVVADMPITGSGPNLDQPPFTLTFDILRAAYQ